MNEKLKEILGDDFDSSKLAELDGYFANGVQSEADKIRTKYSKENRELTEKLKSKELESMSELEKKETLFKESQANWELQRKEWEKDRTIKEKTDFFKEKSVSLDLFDLVKGSNTEEWDTSLNKVTEIINKSVESRMKNDSGRDGIGGNKEPIIISKEAEALAAFDSKF